MVMECTTWMDRNMQQQQQMVMAARQQQQGVVQGVAGAVMAAAAGGVAAGATMQQQLQLLVTMPFLQATLLLVVVVGMLGPQQQQQQRAMMEQRVLVPHVQARGGSVAGVGPGAAGQTPSIRVLQILQQQQQGLMQGLALLQPLLGVRGVVRQLVQLVLRALAGAGAAGVGTVPGLVVATRLVLLRQVLELGQ
jgi:putative Ca2+/H+ antiporter (TMEM165/GDT1 family)